MCAAWLARAASYNAVTFRSGGSQLWRQDMSMAWRCLTDISGTACTKGQLLDRQCCPATSAVGSRYASSCSSLLVHEWQGMH
jgi:hypothetical protein